MIHFQTRGTSVVNAPRTGALLARGAAACALALVLGAAACGTPASDADRGDTLSTRERDSALGSSGIPGARGITRAQAAADSAAARNARLDSLGDPR